MAQPIYKLFMARPTDAWYRLSPDERNGMMAKINAARDAVGGKVVAFCDSGWSSEQWPTFGLEVFPDIESVRAFSARLAEMDWLGYIESFTLLGTEFQP